MKIKAKVIHIDIEYGGVIAITEDSMVLVFATDDKYMTGFRNDFLRNIPIYIEMDEEGYVYKDEKRLLRFNGIIEISSEGIVEYRCEWNCLMQRWFDDRYTVSTIQLLYKLTPKKERRIYAKIC